MAKLEDAFVTYASGILAETNTGLSGQQIVEHLSAYAVDYEVEIPYGHYPFPQTISNKRTALKLNLLAFNAVQQFKVIKSLCDLPLFKGSETVSDLRRKLYFRYGHLATEKVGDTELVLKTRRWLDAYPSALLQFNNALLKHESGQFQRNTLDDMRLAFELLVKDLLANGKSLEKQIADIGQRLKDTSVSVELRNMVTKIIKYYTDYQNSYVKHDDRVNENEIEYVIELTSVVMKFLIKTL